MMRPLLLTLLVLAAAPSCSGEVLPFIENDFAQAMARARAKNAPLFVEAWAPW